MMEDSATMGHSLTELDSATMGSSLNDTVSATMGPRYTELAMMGPSLTESESAAMGPRVNEANSATMGPNFNETNSTTMGPSVTELDSAAMGSSLNETDSTAMGPGLTELDSTTMGPSLTESESATMGPTVNQTDFLPIVTHIKGELSRIMASPSSLDGIRDYITNLMQYIETTEQSTDHTFSEHEENGASKDKVRGRSGSSRRSRSSTRLPVTACDVAKEIEALFPKERSMPEVPDEVADEIVEDKAMLSLVSQTVEEAETNGVEEEAAPPHDDPPNEKIIITIKTEQLEPEENELYCTGCETTFDTKTKLKRHIKKGSSKKRFKCVGCCKSFKHNVSLKLHVVEVNHGKEKFHPVEFEKFVKKLATCDICNKRFLAQSNLDRHMLTHTGSKPFECTVCLKKFKQKRSLLMHIEREGHQKEEGDGKGKKRESKPRFYRCAKCDRIFTTQNQLNSHMKVHAMGANKFGCNHCGRFFTRKESLEKHIAKDCAGDIFPVEVKCSMCNDMFTKKSQLDAHLISHSTSFINSIKAENPQTNSSVENFLNNPDSEDFNNDEVNALANEIALGILGSEASDTVNTTTVSPPTTTQAPTAGPRPSRLAQPSQPGQPPIKRRRGRQPGSGGPPHQCRYCPKTFKTRKEWRNHQYLHTGEKPHICDICGKAFRLRQVMSLHMNTHGENKFKCTICDKTYPYKNQLVRHTYTHSDEKPYRCEQCGKGFISKPELSRHYGVHGGGKTYVCDICGKSCRNIKKHHQAVHTFREKVPCEICHKEYVSKAKLKVHMQTHTATKSCICPLCGKGFALNKYLSKHMILSHGEKKHKCHLCGKAFAFAQQLKMHERTHTVENPGPPAPYTMPPAAAYYPPTYPQFW